MVLGVESDGFGGRPGGGVRFSGVRGGGVRGGGVRHGKLRGSACASKREESFLLPVIETWCNIVLRSVSTDSL